MSTPTPRTDAAFAKWQEGWDRTPFGPDFARTLERELATERAKVKTLREACESIEEQWDKNHSANLFHAGNVMQSHAMRALAATEDAQ